MADKMPAYVGLQDLPARKAHLEGDASLVDADTVRALTACGFHAVQRNMADAAIKIFQYLGTIRTDQDFVVLGLGLAEMTAGRFAKAAEILSEAGERLPDSEEIMAFHVLALLLQGEVSAARDRQAVFRKRTTSSDMVRLAERIEDEIARRSAPARARFGGLV